MTSSNAPNQPDENPFEFSVGSDPDVSNRGGSGVDPTEDEQLQMPPVESSYWTGVGVLGMTCLSACLVPRLVGTPYAIVPFSVLLALFGWCSSLLFVSLPLSMMRLWLHRRNIARAIQEQTYPGGQRFDFWYLVYSLLLSSLSFFGGGILFFGICTGLFVFSETAYAPLGEVIFIPILIFDGIISLLATFFLLRLGIPRYR